VDEVVELFAKLVFALILGAAFMSPFWLPLYLKARALKRQRTNETFESFSDYFRSKGVSKELSLTVYAELQRLAGVRDLPVLPTDSLRDVYAINRYGGMPQWEFIDDMELPPDVRKPAPRDLRQLPEVATRRGACPVA
jgi:hypothetical protein